MAIAVLYWSICIACWIFAFRFGGVTARIAFVLFIAMTVGSAFAIRAEQGLSSTLGAYAGFNIYLFLADSGYFVGLLVIALRSHRYWPIWSAGFALTCMMTHVGPIIDPHSDPRLYRGLASFWQIPILATMVIGIARDRKLLPRAVKAEATTHEQVYG